MINDELTADLNKEAILNSDTDKLLKDISDFVVEMHRRGFREGVDSTTDRPGTHRRLQEAEALLSEIAAGRYLLDGPTWVSKARAFTEKKTVYQMQDWMGVLNDLTKCPQFSSESQTFRSVPINLFLKVMAMIPAAKHLGRWTKYEELLRDIRGSISEIATGYHGPEEKITDLYEKICGRLLIAIDVALGDRPAHTVEK